ncbi:hypothetical protein GALMADRAFT_209796 [Galerina marginata CBS 339.88]|uniref:Uncharacterized protein n=1 Tax=Galerina marginata (strain CBS 339.88) TaxID=685588 RepID=A0A067T557_GALM3|nr:hypothetical protein GALMADRAFT_209796 [Galerina marginata CBS 339.88]
MLIITLLLFSFSLTNLALALRATMHDVIVAQTVAIMNKVAGVPGPTWVTLVMCTNANLSALIADATLMYRCWLVYNKSMRIMIFPIILWVGGVGLTGLEAYWQVVQSQKILHAWQPVNTKVGPGTILTPFWGSTVVLNAYSTGFIAHRIWGVAKSSSKSGISTGHLRFVMRVLVESGGLYLAIATIHFLVWFTPSEFAISVLSSINLPIIGIAFNLILMRTNKKRVDEEMGSSDEEKVPASALVFHHSMRSGGPNATMKTIDIHAGESANTSTVIDVGRTTTYSTSASDEYSRNHV